jgi:hypothetical protein
MIESIIAYVVENKQRVAIFGGIGVLSLVILWNLFNRPSQEKIDHPDGYTFVCQNPSCRKEFVMSISQAQEWRAKHAGDLLKCPQCGGTDVLEKGARRRGGEPGVAAGGRR